MAKWQKPAITDGITCDFEKSKPRLAALISGPERGGKTTLATTLPKPQGWLPLDPNTRPRLEDAWRRAGKPNWFYMPEEDLLRGVKVNPVTLAMWGQADEKLNEEVKGKYKEHMDRVRKAYWSMVADGQLKAVVVDTGTQLVEDMLYTHFGRSSSVLARDRGKPYQEIKDLLTCTDKHLAIVCYERERYLKDKPTGVIEPNFVPKAGYLSNLKIRCVCPQTGREAALLEDYIGVEGVEIGAGDFTAHITHASANALLMGKRESVLVNGEMNMMRVAMALYPERWEDLGDGCEEFGWGEEEAMGYLG
jgi:hypothetical protein